MDPRTLRILAEIIDLGSVSPAADALHVTQPALSQAIKHLESQMGTPVLKRGRNGVTPTKVGEILAREGRTIHSALWHAETAVRQWRAGVKGQLSIGVGAMLASVHSFALNAARASFARAITSGGPR